MLKWILTEQDTSSTNMADDRVLTLSEFAKISGFSVVTLRRQIAGGNGPIITKLSERRIGIRVRHGRAWLDACAAKGAEVK
jgi:predicted DNA-binding transcriptional regulator AlpA